jgi:hypothetical protein
MSCRLVAQEIEMIDAALTEAGGESPGQKVPQQSSGFRLPLESKIKSLKISKHRFKPV